MTAWSSPSRRASSSPETSELDFFGRRSERRLGSRGGSGVSAGSASSRGAADSRDCMNWR